MFNQNIVPLYYLEQRVHFKFKTLKKNTTKGF